MSRFFWGALVCLLWFAPAVAVTSATPHTLSAAEASALAPKDEFRECATCPLMVVIPAGSFTMGSPSGEAGSFYREEPQHDVLIQHPLAVGKFPVTVGEYRAFAEETGASLSPCPTYLPYVPEPKPTTAEGSMYSWRDMGYPQTDRHPAACLSWNDAKGYVEWLARKAGRPYRLLTEAEWECRARPHETREISALFLRRQSCRLLPLWQWRRRRSEARDPASDLA